MKRYIFLDIDGVINTERYQAQLELAGKPIRDELGPFYDPAAVGHLKHIVDMTNAEVVITSSWRMQGIDIMNRAWCQRRMPGILAGITPVIKSSYYCIRGMEIIQWLAENENENEIVSYVIIDDCHDFLPEQERLLVNTDPYIGITYADALRAIDILGYRPMDA